MTGIQAIGATQPAAVSFRQKQEGEKPEFKPENRTDEVEISSKKRNVQPPEISTARLMFGVLTDEQVDQINKSGKLPENAKFVMNGFGSYAICNNFFNFRAGTRELPAGFEVKKNILGFAVVLPKGTDGAFIKG